MQQTEQQNTMQWLPTTRKEVEMRGWNSLDVILFSGDAYVDHPSFGAAIIGRLLESLGLKVAIVPQPNWQDDLRDFKKLGRPNLFFGISPGCMDSMVNHYTAARRRRSDDAYTPGNRSGARPDMPTLVYTRILKELYPDVPVVLGGIEASLRRFTHYDYWHDTLKAPILAESGADMLIYGMGEKPVEELCRMLKKGIPFQNLTNIPQTCILRGKNEKYATNKKWTTITLASHEECLADKRKYAANFRHIEEESNSIHAAKLVQPVGEQLLVVNPPYPPLSTEELDKVYALPFTREGDYLTVTPQGELSSLTVEYAGSSPMFYSGSQGVCLPGCFPYYPWAGYRKIFYAEPDDGIGLSSFIPRTDLPQSDFTVTVTGGKNLQASLPEVDGTYQGTANGFSLMGGLLESEESGPYRLVTSPLAPPWCQVTEEWLDQLQAAITQEEKKRGLSPAIQLSDYVLFQNNETLLNRAGYGLAIGFSDHMFLQMGWKTEDLAEEIVAQYYDPVLLSAEEVQAELERQAMGT